MDNPTDGGNTDDRFFRQPRKTREQQEQDRRDRHYVLGIDEEFRGNGDLAQFHYEEAFQPDGANEFFEERSRSIQQEKIVPQSNPERAGDCQGHGVINKLTAWNFISSDGATAAHGTPGLGGAGGLDGRNSQGILETGCTRVEPYQITRYIPKEEEYDVPRLVTREKPVVHKLSTIELLQNLILGPSMPLDLSFFKQVTNPPKEFLKWTETETMQETVMEKASRTVMVPVTETHYRTVSLPDVWRAEQGLQAARGFHTPGNPGIGLNITGQQNPVPQSVLNQDDILSHYRAYYLQATRTPSTAGFVKPFPNL